MTENSIKNVQKQNLPRERLANLGAESLSDFELLAIILKSGGKFMDVMVLSNFLLKKYQSLHNILKLEINELTKNKYIGRYKALEIKAIYELCKRILLSNEKQIITINNPKDIYHLLINDCYEKGREYLYLISMDSRRKLISKDLIGIGTINELLVSQREILQKALSRDAVNIIIAHNHPSNDPTPSKEDVEITNKIEVACKNLDINLLDHVIISNDSFFSIRSANLAFERR